MELRCLMDGEMVSECRLRDLQLVIAHRRPVEAIRLYNGALSIPIATWTRPPGASLFDRAHAAVISNKIVRRVELLRHEQSRPQHHSLGPFSWPTVIPLICTFLQSPVAHRTQRTDQSLLHNPLLEVRANFRGLWRWVGMRGQGFNGSERVVVELSTCTWYSTCNAMLGTRDEKVGELWSHMKPAVSKISLGL